MQMQQQTGTGRAARLDLRIARSRLEVRSAQRLRWKVFAEEQGARLDSPEDGYDIDDLDSHCEHLIVTDVDRDAVIGTYRLLTAEAARRAGGYYCEREFELNGFLQSRQRLLEVGRSCIASGYRTGAAIALLWSGLADYVVESGHDALIGCASIPLHGNAADAADLARTLSRKHRAPVNMHVTPMRELPLEASRIAAGTCAVPPLIKGYLRSGAVVCGEPYWDPAFNCADLFLYLGVDQIEARYARRFLSPISGGQCAISAVHPAE